MSRLEIILSAMLFVSVLFNIGVFVYARAAIVRLLTVSEELGDLQTMINSFTKHLDEIRSLEMFYGEPIIDGLMEHAISFTEQMDTFEYIYTLTATPDNENLDDAALEEEETIDDD